MFESNCFCTTFGASSLKESKSLNSAGVVPQWIKAFGFYTLTDVFFRFVLVPKTIVMAHEGRNLVDKSVRLTQLSTATKVDWNGLGKFNFQGDFFFLFSLSFFFRLVSFLFSFF